MSILTEKEEKRRGVDWYNDSSADSGCEGVSGQAGQTFQTLATLVPVLGPSH